MKRPRPAFLVLSGLLLYATQASAGRTLTLTYSLGSTVTRDANLFRLAPDVDPQTAIGSRDRSDTVTTTNLGVVADKELGIQRLKLDLQLSTSRYRQFRRLDNDNYNFSGTWQWVLGRRLHGDLSSSRRTALSGFDDSPVTSRNINTLTVHSGNVHFQVAPDWDLFAVLTQNESMNSAADRQTSNYTSRMIDGGVRHVAAAGHQLTLLRRRVDSALVRQDDIEASGAYALSPMTRLSGAVGRSRRHTESGATGVSSGTTGRLGLDWTPSPKTQFNLAARQEISAAASNFSTSTVVRGLRVGAAWTPTEKTLLQFSADRSTREYANDPIAAATPREDRLRNAGLTFSYRPDRRLSLSLSLRDEARDSNLGAFTYRDRLSAASLQFAF